MNSYNIGFPGSISSTEVVSSQDLKLLKQDKMFQILHTAAVRCSAPQKGAS